MIGSLLSAINAIPLWLGVVIGVTILAFVTGTVLMVLEVVRHDFD